MAGRSPARLLAPLALVGFVVALVIIVGGASSDGGSGSSADDARPARTATATATPKRQQGRRTYTVKPGDTPSSIAEKTNVPLSRIQDLNPDLDDQLLAPGDKIKLRP